MHPERSSQTAVRVAISRAAHQLLDTPAIFEDPVAVPLVGPQGLDAIQAGGWHMESRFARGLRAFLVARSRFAEEQLAHAVAQGVCQYVVLGAGMDTFAYRNPHAASPFRVFEVDHPSTQAHKRRQLAAAGIAVPDNLAFVPMDFETQSLPTQLRTAGFRTDQPAFFSWLGVSMYLTPSAVMSTLRCVAQATAQGGGIVFDYVPPIAQQPWALRMRLSLLSLRLAAMGEPWLGFFDTTTLSLALKSMGFDHTVNLGCADINRRYFRQRLDGLVARGSGQLMYATR
jgi:methyltransferase (TIGR00027 family)